jgi:hypothetical protein
VREFLGKLNFHSCRLNTCIHMTQQMWNNLR